MLIHNILSLMHKFNSYGLNVIEPVVCTRYLIPNKTNNIILDWKLSHVVFRKLI